MPDFGQDKAYWGRYLRAYCKTTPGIDGAALTTSNGVIIASVLPAPVDQRLLAAQVAAIASSGYAIVAEMKLGDGAPVVYLRTAFGYVIICFYPVKAKVLITLCSDNAKLGRIRCPDLADPLSAAKASRRIGPFPRFDEGEAEAELDD